MFFNSSIIAISVNSCAKCSFSLIDYIWWKQCSQVFTIWWLKQWSYSFIFKYPWWKPQLSMTTVFPTLKRGSPLYLWQSSAQSKKQISCLLFDAPGIMLYSNLQQKHHVKDLQSRLHLGHTGIPLNFDSLEAIVGTTIHETLPWLDTSVTLNLSLCILMLSSL